MRGVALAGIIATGFGVGAYYATGHFGAFSGTNLLLGVGARSPAGRTDSPARAESLARPRAVTPTPALVLRVSSTVTS